MLDMPQTDGEIKARTRKSTPRISDLWYPRYPRIFREATEDMSFDLRCQYGVVIDLYFERGGPLPDDDQRIAIGLGCDVRKWKHIRRQLFAAGKLYLGTDGLIHNERADEILAERAPKLAKRGVAPKTKRLGTHATPASTSPSTPASTSPSTDRGTGADLSRKPNDNNAGERAMATDARATKIQEGRDKNTPISLFPVARAEKDEEKRVDFQSGRVQLFNGLKAYWLDRFDNDEQRLECALLQIANYVEPNSRRPLETQVSSQLARMVGEKLDRDKRYAKAVEAKGDAHPDQWWGKMRRELAGTASEPEEAEAA